MRNEPGDRVKLEQPLIAEDSSLRHLLLELGRIDLLLRREVARWRSAGQDPNDDFRGLYVSDAMAEALLDQPFGASWGEAGAVEDAGDDALDQINGQINRLAAQSSQPLRLRTLAAAFGLDDFELDALLICLAPALDLRYERIYGYLQDDVTRRRPTANLILNLLCGPGIQRLGELRRFSEPAPLLAHHLLERAADPGAGRNSLLNEPFQVDETVVAWLLGDYLPHPLIRAYAQFWPAEDLKSAQPQAVDDLLAVETGRELAQAVSARPALLGDTLLAFSGPDSAAQEAAARGLARRRGRPLLELELAAAAAAPEDEDLLPALRLAWRDARLTGAVLLVKGWDACLADGRAPARLLDVFGREPGGVILAGQVDWLPAASERSAPVRRFAFPLPRFNQRKALWEHFLREAGVDPLPETDGLAGQFQLTTRQIRDAAFDASAAARAGSDSRPLNAALLAAARAHSNPRLSNLARKIEPRYTWQDIILPTDQLALLKEIITTVLHRPQVLDDWGVGEKLVSSQGVTVLFAGPPGTGKTMAAEIISAELGLDLYKIDLSTIVSKYIGETEKNLERIFNEASSSNAILFFDEADALFGKRSEVRDSHDRYANIETSYLLQRMEAYDGVTILATNLRSNLDEAFTRRLQFSVDFPFPDEADRLRIWQALFPPGVPRDPGLDFPLLAKRFKLAGGNIRNILVSAAYRAAADGGVVTMEHLLHGTRRELQKMGRLVSPEDLALR